MAGLEILMSKPKKPLASSLYPPFRTKMVLKPHGEGYLWGGRPQRVPVEGDLEEAWGKANQKLCTSDLESTETTHNGFYYKNSVAFILTVCNRNDQVCRSHHGNNKVTLHVSTTQLQ